MVIMFGNMFFIDKTSLQMLSNLQLTFVFCYRCYIFIFGTIILRKLEEKLYICELILAKIS